ncbi:MAG: sigma-70 family RNA polymerase sigma factor [Phycisphaerales bacterium]|nr:MAG: sigma-70 family RNA polymerase sigma factor [Phycisphaerales bacterium]
MEREPTSRSGEDPAPPQERDGIESRTPAGETPPAPGDAAAGRAAVPDDMVRGVYERMRAHARQFFSRQGPGHTLQPTALVHEAFLRVMHSTEPAGLTGPRLVLLASHAMRSVLVDHARARQARKRTVSGHRVPLDDVVELYEDNAIDLIMLDEALHELERMDGRLFKVVELRFFGGLSEDDAAEALGLSRATVSRDWRAGRAWLRQQLSGGSAD